MFKGILGKIIAILIAAVAVVVAVELILPLPVPMVKTNPLNSLPAKPVNLSWPAYGQAAIGAKDYGLLARHGSTKSAPIASVAKIITALAVLKQKPLAKGDSGPTITLGASDVASYQQYVSKNGSVVKVQVGEQITEYQALQAMLLPSADNMAYSLAVWAFGSLNAYTTYANNFVKTLGMAQTTVSDASGFSPKTVSTADDLVKLALAAIKNPVVAQITSQKTASVPVAGTVRNVNWMLGSDGIVGIKTGNTDQAGGVFLFAAKRTVNAQSLTIVGDVMNAANLYKSMLDARTLLASVDQNFKPVIVVPNEANVGSYTTEWGNSTAIITKSAIRLLVWQGQPVLVNETLLPVSLPLAAHQKVGTLRVTYGSQTASTELINQTSMENASLGWRLLR